MILRPYSYNYAHGCGALDRDAFNRSHAATQVSA